MTETDTDFLSRMFSQSAVPQGQAADPDMTRLLKMAAEAVRLSKDWDTLHEKYDDYVREASDTIQRLRDGAVDMQLHFDVLKADYDALAAEAVRLREALELAIDVLDHHRHHYDADYFRSQKESTP